jgi:hypothetical protein
MNNDIRKLVDDNWDEIKELIAQKAEAEQKPKNIWDLKTEDGEEYYSIESDGKIIQYMFNEAFDEDTRDIGNAFLTREEAEFEKERRKIEAILRKYSRPFRGEEQNWYLYYNHNNNITDTGVVYEINPGIPLFETKEIALKVMEEIGLGRLKKYWFGVAE